MPIFLVAYKVSSYCSLADMLFCEMCENSAQGCPQDVKSEDRDETETLNPEDRDETRRSKKRLETASRPRRKTETFQKKYRDRSVAV